jgi:hypothetical protein
MDIFLKIRMSKDTNRAAAGTINSSYNAFLISTKVITQKKN